MRLPCRLTRSLPDFARLVVLCGGARLRRSSASNFMNARWEPGLAKPGFRRLSVRPEHPNVDTGAMDPFLLRLTFAAVYRICHGVLNGKSKREPGIIWIRIRLQLAHSKNISAILEKSGRPASQ